MSKRTKYLEGAIKRTEAYIERLGKRKEKLQAELDRKNQKTAEPEAPEESREPVA